MQQARSSSEEGGGGLSFLPSSEPHQDDHTALPSLFKRKSKWIDLLGGEGERKERVEGWWIYRHVMFSLSGSISVASAAFFAKKEEGGQMLFSGL